MSILCTCFYYVLKPLFLLFVVILLLPLVPNLPPNFKFTSFTVSDPPVLEGKIALNTLLNGAERLFENEIRGPEAFEVLNGELYTSLHGGFVAKIVGDTIRPVVKFGQKCEDYIEEAKCGRPLGLFAGSNNLLYVADAYYGIFTYDVSSGEKNRIISPDIEINGVKPKLFNSITVAKDGTIYWTDSTTDVTLQDGLYSLLADGSGRLIKYDPKTKKNTVLVDGLLFANGVGMSPDESFIVVAETGMSRLRRHWLKGPNAGLTDVFVDGLPGLPDNIRSGSEGFLVSLVLARDKDTPVLAQSIYPFPYIRKALARALTLIELWFQKIGEIYPNTFSKRAVHFLGHFEMTKPLSPLRVTLLVLDLEGGIVDCFHAQDGSVTAISDAISYRGQLYLGSPFNQYLGRIKNPSVVSRFQEVFPTAPKVSARIREVPVTQKPTSTTTTTTPKPATTTTTAHRPTTTTTPRPTTTTTTTAPKPAKTTTTTPRPASTSTTTPKPTTTTITTPKPHPTTATPIPKITTTTPKPVRTTSRTTSTESTDSPATERVSPKKNEEL